MRSKSKARMMDKPPDWLIAEMPPGYQTRVGEIQRLSAEIEAMDRIGWLLWQTEQPLRDAVRDMFAALRYETELQPDEATYDVGVKLDTSRRLLVRVSKADGVVGKKSSDLVAVFQTLSEVAGDRDRVVLAANSHHATRPLERPKSDTIAPDALDLLQRIGANFLTTTTLFRIWSVSLREDVSRARAHIDRVHAQNGGAFQLPASATNAEP
jgi:hypothetical protein